MTATIRSATVDDLPGVLAIYNDIVAAAQRGRGLGSQLTRALFAPAVAMGKHVMVGGIEASNAGSLRMHERLGFERVAHFREVGHKFGRWLDLVFVQKFLDAPGAVRHH